jgi:hypothetical protein
MLQTNLSRALSAFPFAGTVEEILDVWGPRVEIRQPGTSVEEMSKSASGGSRSLVFGIVGASSRRPAFFKLVPLKEGIRAQ